MKFSGQIFVLLGKKLFIKNFQSLSEKFSGSWQKFFSKFVKTASSMLMGKKSGRTDLMKTLQFLIIFWYWAKSFRLFGKTLSTSLAKLCCTRPLEIREEKRISQLISFQQFRKIKKTFGMLPKNLSANLSKLHYRVQRIIIRKNTFLDKNHFSQTFSFSDIEQAKKVSTLWP